MLSYNVKLVTLIILINISLCFSQTNVNNIKERVNSFSGNSNENLTTCPSGYCVPYYLCSENHTIYIHGDDLLDDRIGGTSTRHMSQKSCNSFLEVCCHNENILKIKNKIKKKFEFLGCGFRNDNLLDVRFGDITNESKFGEYPWVIAILDNINGKSFFKCGGSLIHPKVVLTAAQCIRGITSLTVRAGEWDSLTNLEEYPDQLKDVEKIYIHENYIPTTKVNDIALLILNSEFIMAENVQTVCLPPQNYDFDITYCTVAGWGKQNFDGNQGKQAILKKVDLPIILNYDCEEQLHETPLGYGFRFHKSYLCAGGEEGKDSCTGDLGAPLACEIPRRIQYQQAGISSWSLGCGNTYPAIYTNIAQFRTWIDAKMIQENLDSSYYTP